MRKYKCVECGNIKDLLINHDSLPYIWESCTDSCSWNNYKRKVPGGPVMRAKDGTLTGFSKTYYIRLDNTEEQEKKENTMAIKEGYKHNFDIILKAGANGDLCLAECTDNKTGSTVITLCAMGRDSEGTYVLSPLAKMFDGDPYEELSPPKVQ